MDTERRRNRLTAANRWHPPEKEMELPSDLAGLASLRVQLLDLGYSRSKVAGCLEWVLGKVRGQDFPLNPVSKSTYRKMLVAVYGTSRDPDGQDPDETGGASVAALAAVTGILGTAAAIASHPAALLGLAPIIPDSVNDEDELAEPGNCCWEPPLLLAA
jgi:hypothetical protein